MLNLIYVSNTILFKCPLIKTLCSPQRQIEEVNHMFKLIKNINEFHRTAVDYGIKGTELFVHHETARNQSSAFDLPNQTITRLSLQTALRIPRNTFVRRFQSNNRRWRCGRSLRGDCMCTTHQCLLQLRGNLGPIYVGREPRFYVPVKFYRHGNFENLVSLKKALRTCDEICLLLIIFYNVNFNSVFMTPYFMIKPKQSQYINEPINLIGYFYFTCCHYFMV